MNAQTAFYRDILGLHVLYPSEVENFSGIDWVTFDSGDCTLALHSGGQGHLGMDTPKIVFEVEDVQAARQELMQRGVVLNQARLAAPWVWVCDGYDPEGNPFSIEAHS